MKKYKALFLDVDGTLVSRKTISPANRKAIFDALCAGVKITITSGRGSFMVVPMSHSLYIDAFGESCSIALNGCEIIKNREVPFPDTPPNLDLALRDVPVNPLPPEIKDFSILKRASMPKEVSDALIDISNRHRIHFHAYVGNSVYFMTPENPRYAKFTKYDGNFHVMVKEKVMEKIAEHYKKLPFHDNLSLLAPKVYENYETPDEIQKIILLNSNPAILDECFKEALFLKDRVNMEYSDSHSLEFTPIEAGKGNALKTVADAFKIPQEDTIAMGDGENDLSMLMSAGLSVVPSNALPSVKEKADVVSPYSCGEDAVAHVIRKYFL